MTEKTPNYNLRRAAVAGGVILGLAGGAAGVHGVAEAAAPKTEAVGETAPVTIDQQNFLDLLDKARARGETFSLQVGEIQVKGPETSLFDEGKAIVEQAVEAGLISKENFDANKSNIMESLLQSGKTANVLQPDAPYITHKDELYGVFEVDLNDDGYHEYIISLGVNYNNGGTTDGVTTPNTNVVLPSPTQIEDN